MASSRWTRYCVACVVFWKTKQACKEVIKECAVRFEYDGQENN